VSDLGERVAALSAGDGAAVVDDRRFVPLLELGSGARLGLFAGPVGEPGWIVVEDGRATVFGPGGEIGFVEPLEQPRAEFDAALERGAAAAGLPAEDVLFAFPVLELARALLARGQPYFSRLVLMWLLPSELRPLKEDIAKVAENDELPHALRDLARRLVVPE
jgi:hypothetical protein